MIIMRMRTTRRVAALMAWGVIVAAGGFFAFRLAAGEQKEAATGPAGEKPAALQKGLLEAARKAYEFDALRSRNAEAVSPEEIYLWSRRWVEAEVDLAKTKGARVDAHRDHLDRMKTLEARTKALAAAGQGREGDAVAGRYFRIQAELWLEHAQAK
jgi:hypothetical protein